MCGGWGAVRFVGCGGAWGFSLKPFGKCEFSPSTSLACLSSGDTGPTSSCWPCRAETRGRFQNVGPPASGAGGAVEKEEAASERPGAFQAADLPHLPLRLRATMLSWCHCPEPPPCGQLGLAVGLGFILNSVRRGMGGRGMRGLGSLGCGVGGEGSREKPGSP